MQTVKNILMVLGAFAVGWFSSIWGTSLILPASPVADDWSVACQQIAPLGWTSEGDFCYDATLGREHKVTGPCCEVIRRRMSRPIRPSSLTDDEDDDDSSGESV